VPAACMVESSIPAIAAAAGGASSQMDCPEITEAALETVIEGSIPSTSGSGDTYCGRAGLPSSASGLQ